MQERRRSVFTCRQDAHIRSGSTVGQICVVCSKLAANSKANVLVFPSCLWLNDSVTLNGTETCVFCYWCSQSVLRRSLAPPPSRTQAARKRSGKKKTGLKKTSGALITGLLYLLFHWVYWCPAPPPPGWKLKELLLVCLFRSLETRLCKLTLR